MPSHTPSPDFAEHPYNIIYRFSPKVIIYSLNPSISKCFSNSSIDKHSFSLYSLKSYLFPKIKTGASPNSVSLQTLLKSYLTFGNLVLSEESTTNIIALILSK